MYFVNGLVLKPYSDTSHYSIIMPYSFAFHWAEKVLKFDEFQFYIHDKLLLDTAGMLN